MGKKEAARYLACHISQVEENNSVVDFYFNDMPGTLLPQHSTATLQTRSDTAVCVCTVACLKQAALFIRGCRGFINVSIICEHSMATKLKAPQDQSNN